MDESGWIGGRVNKGVGCLVDERNEEERTKVGGCVAGDWKWDVERQAPCVALLRESLCSMLPLSMLHAWGQHAGVLCCCCGCCCSVFCAATSCAC